jgi:mannose-6-phosphate isomerase-like protein (cupin superfamily)
MASVVHPDEREPRTTEGADVRVTFDADNGSARLRQAIIRVEPGRSHELPPEPDLQAVLYVAAGTGAVIVDGTSHSIEPGTGAFVVPGEAVTIRSDGPDDLVIVAVHAPRDRDRAAGERKVTIRFDDQPELEASAERTFRYLVNEDAGCFDMTQFVGIVQPSKAPFHSHPYDEVGYIVEGEGTAHIDGESIPLRSGSCFHLGPGEVHCIENSGSGPMWILGVFHPSGSPASREYEQQVG